MLRDYCRESSKDSEYFVGIKYIDGTPSVLFPHGFNISNDEKELRRDIFRLLAVLSDYSKHRDGEQTTNSNNHDNTIPPITDYIYLMQDFLSKGYYTEKELRFVSSSKGKINWKRTIQKEQPYIDNNNVIYLKYQIQTNLINQNNLLSRIHKYCVYKCFSKFGWLFMTHNFIPNKPDIKEDKKLFLKTLEAAINTTFNDEKKRLFTCMISVIEDEIQNSDKGNDSIGVNKFAPVWERMIDFVFGEDNKKDYFPNATWYIIPTGEEKNSSKLEPDTIMKYNGNLFVLDAKYYQYGITNNPDDLPPTSSIHKQLTYGDYVRSLITQNGKHQNEVKDPSKNIYNAFIMPFNCNDEEIIKIVSVAKSNWIKYDEQTPNYHYILGVLIDTKHLMSCYTKHNLSEIEKLSDIIENALDLVKNKYTPTL